MIPAPLPMLKYWPIAACVVAFGAGWTIQGWRCDASQKAAIESALKQQQEAIDRANKQSESLEAELATQEQLNRDLRGRLTREIRHSSYRCHVPANGVQLLEAARTGKATSEPNR